MFGFQVAGDQQDYIWTVVGNVPFEVVSIADNIAELRSTNSVDRETRDSYSFSV